MKKLIKKFEDIMDKEFNSRDEILQLNRPATEITEECKRVAIAFGTYCMDHTCDLSRYLPLKEIFNKFIEEEYGKE